MRILHQYHRIRNENTIGERVGFWDVCLSYLASDLHRFTSFSRLLLYICHTYIHTRGQKYTRELSVPGYLYCTITSTNYSTGYWSFLQHLLRLCLSATLHNGSSLLTPPGCIIMCYMSHSSSSSSATRFPTFSGS